MLVIWIHKNICICVTAKINWVGATGALVENEKLNYFVGQQFFSNTCDFIRPVRLISTSANVDMIICMMFDNII